MGCACAPESRPPPPPLLLLSLLLLLLLSPTVRGLGKNVTSRLGEVSALLCSYLPRYRLIGSSSAYCYLTGSTVDWSDPLPTCTDPPKIGNGTIREESDTYAYRHAVTYVCARGFVLVGKSSIYCTVNNDQGEWSDPPPRCIGNLSYSSLCTHVLVLI
ncbi:Complement decay-accelerating factor [Cricetulus griseus]|uniref:Complement decay-accelerating factor n=1 Tax=Cricetulus griseus TaxID=10029 RepID=G3GZR5_CRIGR|nr:Complement decay-accelerating factor [Cricetulus griseus]